MSMLSRKLSRLGPLLLGIPSPEFPGVPGQDMEKNKRFPEHYTQKVDMSKAVDRFVDMMQVDQK